MRKVTISLFCLGLLLCTGSATAFDAILKKEQLSLQAECIVGLRLTG